MLARGQKFFKLKMGEREDTVSKDRLKPHRAVVDPVPVALCGRVGAPWEQFLVTRVVLHTNVPGGFLYRKCGRYLLVNPSTVFV